MPSNDTAESSLGRTTRNIETGGMIGVHRASGCADMDSSGYIHRDVPVQRKRKRKNTNAMQRKGRQKRSAGKGWFFQFSKELQRCIFLSGRRHRVALHLQDLGEIKMQQRERRKKDKIAAAHSLKQSQHLLIHAIYRFNQYYSSACVKGNVRLVDAKLSRLRTPTAHR